MACGCRDKKRRSGEAGLAHVRMLARTFTKLSKRDSEVYIEGLYNNENLYNFAPVGTDRGEVIELITWQEKE